MWYWEEKGLFFSLGIMEISTYLPYLPYLLLGGVNFVPKSLSVHSTLAEREQTSSGLIQYFASIEIAQDFHLWVCLFLNHKNKRNPSNSLSLGRTLSIQIISDKRRMGAA